MPSPLPVGYREGVRLPFDPPIEPMLAKPADALPDGRRLAVRAEVGRLPGAGLPGRRRGLHPVPRPQAARPVLPRARRAARGRAPGAVRPRRRGRHRRDGGLEFEALLLRIHPAASRVKMLAEQSPASFVAWDLLALGDEDLRETPRSSVAARLEAALAGARRDRVHLTPATTRPGAGGGLVRPVRGRRPRRRDREAPRGDLPAGQAGDDQGQAPAHGRLRRRRLPLAQERARHARRVAAARAVRRRRHAPPRRRHLVVHLGSPSRAHRRARAAARATRSRATRGRSGRSGPRRAPRTHPGQRLPGATSRWNRGKDLSWEPLRVERVAEVAYDHLQGDRFRHGTTFLRWRPDRRPDDCRYDQLEETAAFELGPDLRPRRGIASRRHTRIMRRVTR